MAVDEHASGKLTVRQAAFIGVGAMVGAGIFSLHENAVRGLGNGHVTGIIAWLILAAPPSSPAWRRTRDGRLSSR